MLTVFIATHNGGHTLPRVLDAYTRLLPPPGGWKLVVSDDTGLKPDGTHHAPWLFAMDGAGKVDAEPVPLVGLDKINDPEAITLASDGSFFITTSHSPNKKGKTKPARRILLQARLSGRSLRVVGQVDLTTARSAKGQGLLAIAGVDEGGVLDLEALAFHKDALYIGLKSPLTAGGSAVILRLASPAAVLRAGSIPAGAVTRWAEVALKVAGPSGMVSEGLADLHFLPDGSLVLLGNSPKGLPPDGGGGLWWLRKPAPGSQTPKLLRRYSGLKPEGVTVSSDGRSLILVFDRGQDPPWWSRWPLPR